MHAIKSPIYQTQQIRELERLAGERFNISGHSMMQRAGKAAFDFLQRRWPQAHKLAIFCGSGNNGGDGYVLAYLAHERGLDVTIWQVGNVENIKNEAKEALEACNAAKIKMYPFTDKVDIEHPDVIVDAICGIGVHDQLRDAVMAIIKRIQRKHVPVFALDMPTGIDADTGNVLGAAIHATATLTFIGLKLGLLTGNGIAYTGELAVSDLQLPAELFSYVEAIAERVVIGSYAAYLQPRARDWHKGLSGHVLVIGGDVGMCGAPRLAATAALRVGAGLVSVASRPEHAAMMNMTCPELMCHAVTDKAQLEPLIAKADVIIIGPGLGQSAWSKEMWHAALQSELPLVIDADGLNLLAETELTNENWVLTPHPGEAARLIKSTPQLVQQDRLSAAKMIHKTYGGTCVLKGAGTLILAPNSLPALCDKGNPGMATAGMGDVLSGVIGGMIAQGIPLGDAAKLSVCLHAMAGDLAAKEGERGMIATDLMPHLRRLSNYHA